MDDLLLTEGAGHLADDVTARLHGLDCMRGLLATVAGDGHRIRLHLQQLLELAHQFYIRALVLGDDARGAFAPLLNTVGRADDHGLVGVEKVTQMAQAAAQPQNTYLDPVHVIAPDRVCVR